MPCASCARHLPMLRRKASPHVRSPSDVPRRSSGPRTGHPVGSPPARQIAQGAAQVQANRGQHGVAGSPDRAGAAAGRPPRNKAPRARRNVLGATQDHAPVRLACDRDSGLALPYRSTRRLEYLYQRQRANRAQYSGIRVALLRLAADSGSRCSSSVRRFAGRCIDTSACGTYSA